MYLTFEIFAILDRWIENERVAVVVRRDGAYMVRTYTILHFRHCKRRGECSSAKVG